VPEDLGASNGKKKYKIEKSGKTQRSEKFEVHLEGGVFKGGQLVTVNFERDSKRLGELACRGPIHKRKRKNRRKGNSLEKWENDRRESTSLLSPNLHEKREKKKSKIYIQPLEKRQLSCSVCPYSFKKRKRKKKRVKGPTLTRKSSS